MEMKNNGINESNKSSNAIPHEENVTISILNTTNADPNVILKISDLIHIIYSKDESSLDTPLKNFLNRPYQIENIQFKNFKNKTQSFSNNLCILNYDVEDEEDIESILTERNFPIIIHFNKNQKIDFQKNFQSQFQNIFGFIDTQEDSFLNKPTIVNYILQFIERSHNNLKNLHKNVEEILYKTQKELDVVREIHQNIVPFREFQSKKLNSIYKFSSGEASGGEFFDHKYFQNHYVQILVRSNSYLATTYIISEVERLKRNFSHITQSDLNLEEDKKVEIFAEKIHDFVKNLIKIQHDMQAHIEYFVSIIDSEQLFMNVWSQSQCVLLINGQEFELEQRAVLFPNKSIHRKIRLQPQSILTLFSSGFQSNARISGNWDRLLFIATNYAINHRQLINSAKEVDQQESNVLSAKNLLNELFFELKKHSERTFLKYDSLAFITQILP